MAKPNYEKPASQLDLEARQKKDYVSPSVLTQGVDREPSENGYVNVDPVYQNYANETERPYLAEKGAEAEVEKAYYSEDVDTSAGAAEDGEGEEEEEEEEDKKEETPSTPSSPSTPRPPSN